MPMLKMVLELPERLPTQVDVLVSDAHLDQIKNADDSDAVNAALDLFCKIYMYPAISNLIP